MTQVTIKLGIHTTPELSVGQLAVVNCSADLNTDIGPNMSSLHKEWYHNNEIITTDLAEHDGILQLKRKFKTSFAGYYKCVAWIGDDNTMRNGSNTTLFYVLCELCL